MFIGIVGIILSLVLLIYLAYRGISVLILAPLLALFASIMNGEASLLATYTEVYMPNLATYIRTYFPLFLLGAIFGKIMDDSGSAKSISMFIVNKVGKEKSILAIVLSCALLTYGGISLFVVAFAIYPIGATLFKESHIPKRLLPATIALGAFTFTMTALPGSPQIQNAIPMAFFGTDIYAAPILGLVAAVIIFVWGVFWLQKQSKKAHLKNEGYGNHKETLKMFDTSNLPSIGIALLPIVVVFTINALFIYVVLPAGDSSYLSKFNTSLSKIMGNWALIVGLIAGILVCAIANLKRLNPKESLNNGASGSLLPILNTASEVGYGNVIATLASFALIKTFLTEISPNILVSEAVTVSALAGITGSASGGLSIALAVMGETFLTKANEIGLNPQVLHRVASISCGWLDTLPHNGAVITLLGITGLTHRQSYADIGICTIVGPTLAVAVIIVLAGFGIV